MLFLILYVSLLRNSFFFSAGTGIEKWPTCWKRYILHTHLIMESHGGTIWVLLACDASADGKVLSQGQDLGDLTMMEQAAEFPSGNDAELDENTHCDPAMLEALNEGNMD